MDIQNNKSDHNFYVLANDNDKSISDNIIDAFSNYNITVLPCSKREERVDTIKTG
ncbi:DUF1829 domain-containing protein [Pontibacillus salicampi]|uniref:DUF1829 domain-containing protein n=1 Tax=Pontibacillus salicampi TaxID=1449801 RepID=A0ABV6LTT2_9BACI